MNIAVASRFACLKIEDDEGQSNRKQQPAADGGKKKVAESGRKGVGGGNGKKPAQKMSSNPKRAKKVQEQMEKQWEEWKEKDDKLVIGNYEQDLESALLLSKIHFEENKDKYVSKQSGKRHEKKKKTKTMSLDEFLAKDAQRTDADCNKEVIENENFFEQLHTETKKLCKKDEVSQLRKDRENTIEELISSSQYSEKLEVERKRNKDMEEELQKAREEISNVKSRNQTLCTMLSTGEMKDKADVLLELERLSIIKNDLTDEVARLHGLLEQERSKVASLTAASLESINYNSNKQHKENKDKT
ncbi:PREDICTED: G kinase-anchoring protein 1-like isoform X2 [Nicrophorus vespilloides]|uniref:G kinase-anchoring protein 1-like isoform X2 n=1 Tax=Nicrophorus vespilloides TaxID=110193 RepID=A0ABM1MJQ2_NICVS|nr:PREDICTED: G kinase-anchoring protein 1-like isoform X2 [Nicrophorus vespilloides]